MKIQLYVYTGSGNSLWAARLLAQELGGASFEFMPYPASDFPVQADCVGLIFPLSHKGKSLKEVTLRFSPLKSRWIREQIWHKDQKMKFLEDGSLELSFPVADFSEIRMEILRHGDMVEVIKPESLRELIKAEAENITKIY